MQHREADVCDDYTHCAAYLDLAAAASARWGEQAGEKLQKIQEAVRDTAGEIVTKDGAAIVAVFHAASAAHRVRRSGLGQRDPLFTERRQPRRLRL